MVIREIGAPWQANAALLFSGVPEEKTWAPRLRSSADACLSAAA